MELSVRKAEIGEQERVRDFYYALIDQMQSMPYQCDWKKGIYPEDATLKAAIDSGTMYLAEAKGKLVGAMIMNHKTGEGYGEAHWQVEAAADEVTVIHLLGVLPEVSCRGIGGFMVREAIRLARLAGQKALRLDVLQGNVPALRLYQREGFTFVKSIELYYKSTGRRLFDLYEYVL